VNGGSRTHEAFQGVLARGTRLVGGIWVSASTTAPCDGIIFPPIGSGCLPCVVEVKTRRDRDSATLPPPQRELQSRLCAGGFLCVHIVAILRVQGHRKGTREPFGKVTWVVSGESSGPAGDKYRTYLNSILNRGYTFQVSETPTVSPVAGVEAPSVVNRLHAT
jgi:hypothetical protein